MDITLDTIPAGQFDVRVLKAPGLVLVDFGNKACAPCRAQEPILSELADEYVGRVAIMKLDTFENQDVARAYGVRNIPRLSLFRDGKEIANRVGLHNRAELRDFIDAHL